MVYNLYVVTLNVRIATTPSGFIYVVALIVRKHLLYQYDGLRHLKGLQVVHLMFKELRHLLGLYDALNVRSALTTLGFICCCTCCKKGSGTLRVYMLLHHVLVRCGRVSAGGSGTHRRRPKRCIASTWDQHA